MKRFWARSAPGLESKGLVPTFHSVLGGEEQMAILGAQSEVVLAVPLASRAAAASPRCLAVCEALHVLMKHFKTFLFSVMFCYCETPQLR